MILYNGLGFFWPRDVLRATLADGKTLTGQVVEREPVPGAADQHRIKLKVANRDLYGADFQWVDESQITRREYPPDVAVIERTEWGLLIGAIKEVREGGQPVAVGAGAAWDEVQKRLPGAARVRREIQRIETGAIGDINYQQEKIRLRLRGLELRGITPGAGGGGAQGASSRRCRRSTWWRRPGSARSGRASRPAWWSWRTAARRRSCRSRRWWTSGSRTP